MPHARPMPGIAPRVHELRIADDRSTWRIVVALEPDAVVVLDVFMKRTRTTPLVTLRRCRQRLDDWRSHRP